MQYQTRYSHERSVPRVVDECRREFGHHDGRGGRLPERKRNLPEVQGRVSVLGRLAMTGVVARRIAFAVFLFLLVSMGCVCSAQTQLAGSGGRQAGSEMACSQPFVNLPESR